MTKSLIVPAPGRQPTFDNVTNIVFLGMLCDLSVCVICLSEESWQCWQGWREKCQGSVTLMDLFNINQAVLADWETFLGSHPYDMIVLDGARVELQADRISVGYVTTLVEAVPSGMVMVA